MMLHALGSSCSGIENSRRRFFDEIFFSKIITPVNFRQKNRHRLTDFFLYFFKFINCKNCNDRVRLVAMICDTYHKCINNLHDFMGFYGVFDSLSIINLKTRLKTFSTWNEHSFRTTSIARRGNPLFLRQFSPFF